mmetsp:Transcript_101245/g.294825  ORF Transcript_101245/g.294825 Transcript_101245/m.294825 type:complete len:82 (+) Transcript_101245:134-379(+)
MPDHAVLLEAPASTPVMDLPPVELGDLGLAQKLASHVTQCTGTQRQMGEDAPMPSGVRRLGHLVGELPNVLEPAVASAWDP